VGDNVIIFFSTKDSECSRIATKYNLYKDIRIIDVCTELEMLKVKVPNTCLGTAGVSLRREGRYINLPVSDSND
jgi:hypothetical protein